jgi:hypothetical protein
MQLLPDTGPLPADQATPAGAARPAAHLAGDRAAALAIASLYPVFRASLIVDSYGGNDRNFVITSISAEGNVAPIPERRGRQETTA